MAPSLDQSQAKSYTNSGTRWRVVAFRAVRDGELETIQKLCEEQPVLLHDRFTKEMEEFLLVVLDIISKMGVEALIITHVVSQHGSDSTSSSSSGSA